jgi:flagellar biosynthesis protein FliP
VTRKTALMLIHLAGTMNARTRPRIALMLIRLAVGVRSTPPHTAPLVVALADLHMLLTLVTVPWVDPRHEFF